MYSFEAYPNVYPQPRQIHKPRGEGFGIVSFALLIAALATIIGALLLPLYAYALDPNMPVDLDGAVTDAGGDGLEDVRITVRNTSFEAQTTDDGKFEFKDFPAGEHDFVAEKDGYETTNITALVANGFFDSVSIEMEQGNGNSTLTADYSSWDDLWISLFATTIMGLIFSPFIFLGSRFAASRTRFSVVLVGSLSALFMLPIFMSLVWWTTAIGIIVSLLGMISLVMAVTDRKGFAPAYQESEPAGEEA
jgi:hypothetical protein